MEKDDLHRIKERAEKKLQEVPLESFSEKDSQELIHDLRVSQIEIEMQNEELRDAKEQLERSRDHFSLLFDISPNGIVILDEKMTILETNNTFSNMLDLNKDEILGKSFSSFLLAESRPVFMSRYKAFFKFPSNKSIESVLIGKDNDIDVQISATKKPSSSLNEIESILVNITDITSSKQIEERLKANEEKLRITFENIGDAIIVFDKDLKLTMLNNAATKIVHWTQEQCMGKHVSEVFENDNFTYLGKSMFEIFNTILEAKKPYNIEKALFHCVGNRDLCFNHGYKDYFIEDSISPIIDDHGEILGVVIVFRDVTSKVENENKTKKLEEQLIQSQKMDALGQFSGGIAHDFNNIVTSINGYADLALEVVEEMNNERLKKYINNIKLAGDRSAELTRKILAFSRQQIVKTEVIDINKVIEIFLDLTSRITGEDIEIITDFKAKNRINANVNQVERIILNLLSNSKDAISEKTQIASEKKIIIETRDTIVDNKNYVEITVSDSGVGISRDNIEKIFEPFFTTKEEHRGSGMGLATVYGIVHQNGGQINVYSEIGQGATIKIYWPVSESLESEVIIGNDKIKRKRENIEKVILFVEDEGNLVDLVSEFLVNRGFIVYTAKNGQDALERFNFQEIDLIVTDVIMPKMNGKEFIDNVKKIRSDINVLFTSGYTKSHIVNNGIIADGIEFLSKPYDLGELLDKIDEIIGNY